MKRILIVASVLLVLLTLILLMMTVHNRALREEEHNGPDIAVVLTRRIDYPLAAEIAAAEAGLIVAAFGIWGNRRRGRSDVLPAALMIVCFMCLLVAVPFFLEKPLFGADSRSMTIQLAVSSALAAAAVGIMIGMAVKRARREGMAKQGDAAGARSMKRKLTIIAVCIVLATLAVSTVYACIISNRLKESNAHGIDYIELPFAVIMSALIIISEIGFFVGIYKRWDNKMRGRSAALPWALITVSVLCLITTVLICSGFRPVYSIWHLFAPGSDIPLWLTRSLSYSFPAAAALAGAAVILMIVVLEKYNNKSSLWAEPEEETRGDEPPVLK